jgi:hypothetical protein
MMSIRLPTSPRSSRSGDNDDAALNAVRRELDNIVDDGRMRAYAGPVLALCLKRNENDFSVPLLCGRGCCYEHQIINDLSNGSTLSRQDETSHWQLRL